MKTSSETAFYIEELAGKECWCGKTKKSGMSFCYGCYKSLPRDMQKDLYQKIGLGYEEAFDAAIAWLE